MATRLTGEAARKWIAEHPGASYTNNRTGQRFGNIPGPVQQEPEKPLLERFFMGATKPLRSAVGLTQEFGMTIGDLIKAAQGEDVELGQRPNNYLFNTEEESEALYRDPLQTGVKSAAGIGAYGVPVGGIGGNAFRNVGAATLKGAGAGALGGFGGSEEGEELEGALWGSALGGLLGGTFQGVAEAAPLIKTSKLAQKLSKTADDYEVGNFGKKIGVRPTSKQGKNNLIRDAAALSKVERTPVRNADDLYELGTRVLERDGKFADRYAQEFAKMGGKVSLEDVLAPLEKELKSIKSVDLRRPLEAVIKKVKQAAGRSKMMDASDLLQLRREWGRLGNWNALTPANQKNIASAYETLYHSANKVLDDSFQSIGLTNFRDINHVLKTAIEMQNWARVAKATQINRPVWTDMVADATFFGSILSGSPAGGILGAIGTKLMQSKGNQLAEGALRKGAGATQGIQNLFSSGAIPGAANIGQRAIPAITSGDAQSGLPLSRADYGQQPMQNQYQDFGGGMQPGVNEENMLLAQLVMSGQLSTTEAKYISELLGIGGEGEVSTLSTAIDELERLYAPGTEDSLSVGKKTTGISGLINKGMAVGKGAFNQDFADRKTAYEQQRALAVGIINKAREAGVLNEGEYQVMVANMPNEYTSDRAAEDWFYNVRRMLLNKQGTSGGTDDTQSVSALYEMLGL